MRALLQRVSQANVEVGRQCVGSIGRGLLVLIGVGKEDVEKDADFLAEKLTNIRVFPDESGKMNRSLIDICGQMLIISQFTLYADTTRGRRPGFEYAAPPEQARRLYEYLVERVRSFGIPVETGIFQAEMSVSLTNEGPVTLLLESKNLKL